MRFALVFLAVVTVAQSQPPSPTPPKISQTEKQQTESKSSKPEANQQPSSPSPVNIFRNFAPSADGKQEQSGYPSKNESSGDGTPKIISDLVMALATVAIAYLGYRQWDTLKEHKKAFDKLAEHMGEGLEETKKVASAAIRSADAAERTIVATQRPFLLLECITHQPLLDKDGHIAGFVLTPEFRNSGHSPALNAQCFSEIVVLTSGADVLEHTKPTKTMAGPTAALTVGAGSIAYGSPRQISADECGRISRKQIAIFIHIYCEYRDGFPGTPMRHTSICLRVLVIGDLHTEKPFAFRAGPPEHNEAD